MAFRPATKLDFGVRSALGGPSNFTSSEVADSVDDYLALSTQSRGAN
jgi:hypothetical protein